MTADEIKTLLMRTSRCDVNSAGESRRYLSPGGTISLSRKLGLNRREVEIAALEAAITPERYRRNIGSVGTGGQVRLLKAKAGVVGAGGLGGFAVELLARCGVGRLTVIDGDSFEPANLNRQLYATESGLFRNKAAAAKERVREINSAVEVIAYPCRGDAGNLPGLLRGCDLVLDCLDNLPSRFALEEACQKLKIPLVHGAVSGFTGQVAVIQPERPLLATIYGRPAVRKPDQRPEAPVGIPAFTPAAVAARQVAEAVKLLTDPAKSLKDTLVLIDLHSGETAPVALAIPDRGRGG